MMDRELAAMTTEEREEEMEHRDEVRAVPRMLSRRWLRELHLNKEMAEGSLAKAMERVLDFLIEQLKGMRQWRRSGSRPVDGHGGAAALTQKQRDDIKRAFKLKKA